MIDPRNMPCARVCLSRLSPRELPPNALQQLHSYSAERKKGSTSLSFKEDTASGFSSLVSVNHSIVLQQCDNIGTESGDDLEHPPAIPSHPQELCGNLTTTWERCSSSINSIQLPVNCKGNKLRATVSLSPVTRKLSSCSAEASNNIANEQISRDSVVDCGSGVHVNCACPKELNSAVRFFQAKLSDPLLECNNSTTVGTSDLRSYCLENDKPSYDRVSLSPPIWEEHNYSVTQRQSRKSSSSVRNVSKAYVPLPRLETAVLPSHVQQQYYGQPGKTMGQCRNATVETRQENYQASPGNTQNTKGVNRKRRRKCSYNGRPSARKMFKYEDDMVSKTSSTLTASEVESLDDCEQVSDQSTISASRSMDGERSSEAGADADWNFPTGFSSWSDHMLYDGEDACPQGLASYSPPESPRSSAIDSYSSDFLGLSANMKSSENFVTKECTKILPGEMQAFHVDKHEQSTKPQPLSGIDLDNTVHLKMTNARRLSTSSSGLLTPEVKLVPLDRKDSENYKKKGIYVTPSGSKNNGRNSCSPKQNLVVKIVDVGNKLLKGNKGDHSLISQLKNRCTISGRRIPNYSEDVLAKNNIRDLPSNEVKKRKRASKKGAKGLLHAMDLKDSAVKRSKQRKQKPRYPADRMSKIPKQYESTKFSEIQGIRRMNMRYRVAFAKWPHVFSGALDLINQRLVNQNALLHFLGNESNQEHD